MPENSCVEVPCLVDGDGIHPQKVAPLPPQLAALMQTNLNVQELTVDAMLDPHTVAELSLDQIWKMVDELIEAHGEYMPASLRS